MPPPDPARLGPLRGLIGTWEGDQGLDVAFHNSVGKIVETPFRERTTFSPFGPVDNGKQCLFGLDYRTAAWRGDEVDPFHTEVGYWLFDEAAGQVMRGFLVPRGVTVLAGGPASATSTSFTMKAVAGDEVYGICSNPFLATAARSSRYEVTVTVGDGEFSYDETTTLEHSKAGEYAHTDRNTLRRVAA